MNATHDPRLRSFLPVAPDSPFPIQNLPYGVFLHPDNEDVPHVGVAIGDYVVDLWHLDAQGLLDGYFCGEFSLNAFLEAGPEAWSRTRRELSRLLADDESALRDNEALREAAIFPLAEIEPLLPFEVGDYTDFYSSREHATNVGIMFRGKENALMPNWLHLPVGYHGRSSSVVVSGTDVYRPLGQMNPADAPQPLFGPSKALDFELELGCVIGPGNLLGQPISVRRAAEHVFGMVLVNDWSARDIQRWEYQPLGPFLGKNFATSISPWVVTLEALEPFRCEGPVQEPAPLPYLRSEGPWSYDLNLEVYLQTLNQLDPVLVCRSNARYLYWNLCQQVAHHTINGCNLRAGDLLASGTISGPAPDSYGSLLELAWKATKPITLPSGEQRSYLQDGDRVIMTGWCQGEGYRIGFGEVVGQILPAPSFEG